MNTTSDRRRSRSGILAAAAALALGSCIQGPWDYYPHNPPPFRGVYLNGYVLAGKPVDNVCFERVLDLSEEATQAFAFYDSADVRIAGHFSNADSLVLTPVVDTPNCFRGDTAALAEKDQEYRLSARFHWDSAGSKVVSVLTATARVPTMFSIHRTAAAPSFAKTGGVPSNIFSIPFFLSLPPNVQAPLIKEYGDSLGKYQTDTTGVGKYLAANGQRIQKRLLGLLENDHFVYHEGDTLFYLNGALNTLSHYYSSDRSADVGAVLITQRFDSNSSRPETRFDSPLGIKPDSSQYYFPGTLRRLLIYPDAKNNNSWNLLDSIGVVNTWFHTLRNRLYFYGFEKAYYDYLSTVVQTQGGGGGGVDPRIKPKYNVIGGNGAFVGGIPDSFDIYIQTDSLTKAYPLQATHGLFCAKDGWADSKDCREYYPRYCRERNYKPEDCAQAAVTACLIADLTGDTALHALCAPVADSARGNANTVQSGENQFCLEQGFPADKPACAGANRRCLETQGKDDCKRALWDYCLDHDWRPAQCAPGLASYCHDRPRLSETLCSHADAYCAAHPGSVLCK